ncbi:hypothetical protein CY34DRAFT_19899 [Suillus luteus UH-Slu-Lm8-n1]|uniref:Uncharacterized protein n=1 Tax=Suillus luteus UH-Slu-Lm8-n1 TaxID=930992 RepID=A0A0C9ZZX1_9AGAM|nr:hypothetical protein CY34DRAFT_19899 [Suillus luteus UH-Slu-Lm8-n1]
MIGYDSIGLVLVWQEVVNNIVKEAIAAEPPQRHSNLKFELRSRHDARSISQARLEIVNDIQHLTANKPCGFFKLNLLLIISRPGITPQRALTVKIFHHARLIRWIALLFLSLTASSSHTQVSPHSTGRLSPNAI